MERSTKWAMLPNRKFIRRRKNRVMHIALPIGGDLLMASDIVPSFGQNLTVGNNNYVSIFPDSREDAERIFKGLSEGGNIEMPLEDQF
ncbi:hypothetical protein [Chryseobacterium indoltheticum]|uniref:hypothetical protein n=1 Tax=Chryseobacterium indoltheticum TaxID=254 RepID=UPI003F496AFF